jgi:glucose uptake protein GlcU
MLVKSWNWKKALVIVFSSFVLLVSGVGLTGCQFPGGEEQEQEGNPQNEEMEDDDEDEDDD